MGHAVCAYLGSINEDTYIYESISRTDILFTVQNAMLESAVSLHKKFNMPLADMIDHIGDLLRRFGNRALKDTCERVGADMERKLGPADRLIGAMGVCLESGVTPAFISIGGAAAVFCFLKEQSLPQTGENASRILEKTSGLKKDSQIFILIMDMYGKIRQGKNLKELIKEALGTGNKKEVI